MPPHAAQYFKPGRVAAAVIISVLVLLLIPIEIQANGYSAPSSAEAVGGWFPWEEGVGAPRTGLTPAETEAVTANLENIAQVLRRSEALVRGAEVLPIREIGTRRELEGSQPGPATYRLGMMIFLPSRKEARTSGGHISVLVNSPYATAAKLFKDAGVPIYLEYPVTGQAGEFSVHLLSPERSRSRDMGWVITPGGRSPWKPVSRERWIKALIRDAQSKLAEFEQEVTEQAQQRRARFEHTYEGMKRLAGESEEMLARVAEMREQFEARESGFSQAANALSAGNHDLLEKLGRRDLALFIRVIPRLEAELAAMPPEVRRSPAYCCEASPVSYFAPPSYATLPSLLVEPGDERASPLLTPNPDFFRCDLPAPAVQSITVTQRMTRPDMAWKSYMEAVRQDLTEVLTWLPE